MATETLRPNGSVTTNWPSLTGASHHAATSDDSDSTYIRNNTTTPQTDVLDLTDTALTTETITGVDVRFRVRSETSAVGECQVGVRLSGTDSLGTNRTSIPTTATDYSDTSLARPGGGSWSVSDLNSLQVVAIGDGNTTAVRLFELYVDIQYTAGGGTQNIDAGFISSGNTVYTPTLTPGAVNISPSLKASAYTVYTPTLSSGAANIAPSLLSLSTTFYTPTLTPGAVNISPSLKSSAYTVYTPAVASTLQYITPSTLASTLQIYVPSLSGGVPTDIQYLLNGVSIPGPQSVEETNSTLYAQNQVLEGSINRVFFGDNKRMWILKYTNTKVDTYNILYALYANYLNSNSTISWEVTGENYTVDATSVHIDLPSRSFSPSASHYISDFELILTEA